MASITDRIDNTTRNPAPYLKPAPKSVKKWSVNAADQEQYLILDPPETAP